LKVTGTGALARAPHQHGSRETGDDQYGSADKQADDRLAADAGYIIDVVGVIDSSMSNPAHRTREQVQLLRIDSWTKHGAIVTEPS
jgi:hypothetical protein